MEYPQDVVLGQWGRAVQDAMEGDAPRSRERAMGRQSDRNRENRLGVSSPCAFLAPARRSLALQGRAARQVNLLSAEAQHVVGTPLKWIPQITIYRYLAAGMLLTVGRAAASRTVRLFRNQSGRFAATTRAGGQPHLAIRPHAGQRGVPTKAVDNVQMLTPDHYNSMRVSPLAVPHGVSEYPVHSQLITVAQTVAK